jgi:hypothetical protein
VGTGGTGFTLGTIIGFGSIIMDSDSANHYSSATGTYYADNSTAPATTATTSTTTSSTALGVGQQLEITLDSSGNPTTVISTPSLVGAVASSPAPSASGFYVNGVQVKLNTLSNTLYGPLTYFVGYTGATAIAANDQVEVHGFYTQDANGNPYVQATRVVLLPSTNVVTRTVGVIPAGYTTGTFSLGNMTVTPVSSTIQPSGTTLAAGQYVSVWSSGVLTPVIRVRSISSSMGTIKVAGIAYGLSGTGFYLSGVPVTGSISGISNGTYVVASGTANGSTLTATTITIPTSGASTTVELKGTITNYVSNANFQVRGTSVDASAMSSPPSGLANGVYVDVIGSVSGNTVSASSITFGSTLTTPLSTSVTPVQNTTVEFVGTINSSPVPSCTGGFTITQDSGNTVSFTMASRVGYEGGACASNLVANTRVNVEASWNGSSYAAYGIQFLSAAGASSTTPPPSGTGEVSGVVSGLSSVGSVYTFTVNNTAVQWTCSVACPLAGLVNGARVDVRFTPGTPNVAISTPSVSSSIED